MTAIIIFFVAHWYLSLFCQTFFLHRYAAHSSFTMSRGMEKFFYILTFLFQGSNYLSAYAYGVMHRLHHAYADTERDPHSPKYDLNLFAMMFKTYKVFHAVKNDEYPDAEEKYKKGVPRWDSFDKFASNRLVRILWGALYVLFYMEFVPAGQWWLYLLLPVHFLMSPVHGAIINWFAHVYGYVNFKVGDTSKNFLPFDFLMLGESYHNNHHKYGSRANFGGIRWHEIDPTYIIIKILDKVGVIKLKKTSASITKEIEKAKAA